MLRGLPRADIAIRMRCLCMRSIGPGVRPVDEVEQFEQARRLRVLESPDQRQGGRRLRREGRFHRAEGRARRRSEAARVLARTRMPGAVSTRTGSHSHSQPVGLRFKERKVRPGARRTALGLLDDQPAEPGQLHRADHDGHDQPRSSPAGNRDGRRDRTEAVEVRPRQPRAGARYMDD